MIFGFGRDSGRFTKKELLLLLLLPVIASAVFLLPTDIKEQMIIDYTNPSPWASWTSDFVHMDFDHLFGNMKWYFVFTIPLMYFMLKLGEKRKLYLLILLTFILLPLTYDSLQYILTNTLWGIESSYGSSTIISAYFGMVPIAFLALSRKLQKTDFGKLSMVGLTLILSITILYVGIPDIGNDPVILPLILFEWGLFSAVLYAARRQLKDFFKKIRKPGRQSNFMQYAFIAGVPIYILGIFTFFPCGCTDSNIFAHFVGYIFGLVAAILLLRKG
jgi:membrane associated rhomboid family serine protease